MEVKEVRNNADNNADNHMGDISAHECRDDYIRCAEFAYVCLKDYDNQKEKRPKKFLGKISGLLKLVIKGTNDVLFNMGISDNINDSIKHINLRRDER